MGHTKEEAPKAYSLRISDNALQNIDDLTGYIAYVKDQKTQKNQVVIINHMGIVA